MAREKTADRDPNRGRADRLHPRSSVHRDAPAAHTDENGIDVARPGGNWTMDASEAFAADHDLATDGGTPDGFFGEMFNELGITKKRAALIIVAYAAVLLLGFAAVVWILLALLDHFGVLAVGVVLG